ncbi:MAG: hypothetical protein ACM3OB_07880 [Acidobacteriota bacterium]
MKPRDRWKSARYIVASVVLLGSLSAGAARAAEQYLGTISMLGGLGGSLDAEPKSGYNNVVVQAGFGMAVDSDLVVGVRVGRLQLDKRRDTFAGVFAQPRMDYLTLAGEYRIDEGYYHSGLLFGLGAYRLNGKDAAGSRHEDAPGVCLGVSGEFPITQHAGFLVELVGHYANFKEAQLFATAQAGLAIHF